MAKSLFVCSGTLSPTTAGTTQYLSLVSGATVTYLTVEPPTAIPYRTAGTFSKLYVRISSNSTSASSTIKTRKNATTDGNLTVSVGSGATGVFEDTSNTDAVAGTGDTWNYSLASGGTGTFTLTAISVLFEATTSTDTVTRIATVGASSYTGTTVRYNPLGGLNTSGSATEANAQVRIKKSLTAKNLAVTISNNLRTTSTTIKTRKNTADGNMSLSYAGGTTGIVEEASPGTNTDSLVNNDLYCTAVANGSGVQAHLITAISIDLVSSSSANVGLGSNGLTTGITVNSSLTIYNTTSGQFSTTYTTESNAQVDVRADFSFSNLVIFNASNSINAASTFTFRKNGSGTALTLSIASSTSGVFENTSDTITTSAASNDLVDLELVAGATGTTMIVRNVSVYTTAAAAALFTRDITESSISVSDSNTRVPIWTRPISESAISVSDSLARLLTASRSISESSIVVSDSVAAVGPASTATNKSIIAVTGETWTLTANQTTYFQVMGSGSAGTTESQKISNIRPAGAITNLVSYVYTNGVTASSTLTLRNNTADTALSVTIPTSTTGEFTDTSDTVSVAAGDNLCYKIVIGTTGTSIALSSTSFVFTPTDTSVTVSKIGIYDATFSTNSATRYLNLGGYAQPSSTESDVQLKIKKAGAFKYLDLTVITNGRGTATTFRFRKNSANGNQSISVAGSGTGQFEDTTNSDTVAVDDLVNLSYTTSTGGGTITWKTFGTSFESTTNTTFFDSSFYTGTTLSTSTTNYFPVTGLFLASATEANYAMPILTGGGGTLSNFLLKVSTNTITAASTGTVRSNTADTTLTVSITASSSGYFEDNTHTHTLASGDKIDIKVVTGGTGTSVAIPTAALYLAAAAGAGTLFTTSISESSITVSDSNTRVLTAMRALSESSISVSDSLARLLSANRSLSESSITVSDSLVRRLTALRALAESTITVSETLARLLTANRSLAESSIAISDSLARILIAVRVLSDTITVSDAINAFKVAGLITRSITESAITVSDSLARSLLSLRSLSDTVTVSETLARLLTAKRAISESTITVSETLNRVPIRVRSLADTITVSDSLARIVSFFRILSESTISVSESLVRRLTANRIITESSITVSETLAIISGKLRTISETVTVSDSLARMLSTFRTISESTIVVSEALVRRLLAFRTISEPSISVSETVARLLVPVISLSETVIVSDSLARILMAKRTLSDTITVSDLLAAAKLRVRLISETPITVSDSLGRRLFAFRVMGETVFVSEVLLVVGPDYEVAVYISDRGYSNPLRARIQFINRAEPFNTFYTYDSFNPDARPFNIVDMSVRLAQGEIGAFSMTIEDSAGIVDKAKIGLGVKVVVEVRKEFATPYFKLITGFIRKIRPLRPATGALLYHIEGYGSQVVFNERIVNFKRAAKRANVDSTIPLSTDIRMQAHNLFSDLITATDILPLKAPSIQSTGKFELTEISPEVTDFIAQMAPGLTDAAAVANALAEITGAIWGTDAAGNPFFRYPTQKHSGILVKDAPVSTDSAVNTSVNLDAFDFDDSIDVSEGFANRLYVLNAVDTRSTASSSKGSGSTTLTRRGIAQQWEATDNNVTSAAFILSRVGNPTNSTGSISGKLRADNNGYPNGATLATFEIPMSSIETSRSTIFVNDIKTAEGVINPGQKYWWYLLGTDLNDDSNTIRWHHDNDLSTANRLSAQLPLVDTDPTKPGSQLNWIRSTFGPVYAFSTFSSVRHILTQSDSESIKQYGLIEGIVDLPAFEDDATFQKALAKIIYTSAKPKRTYQYNRLTIPTQRIFYPGEMITLIDSKASLTSEKNVIAEIAEVSYNFDTGSNAIGCKYVDIRLIAFLDKALDDYMDTREC